MMDSLTSTILSIVPILAAVTVHEVAHGWAAYKLGDPTAKLAGRLTLNPIKHLDFVGTVVFLVTRTIGWAKPVPINPYNFRNQRVGIVVVSLAGPVSNILLACVFSLLHWIIGGLPASGFFAKVFLPLYLMLKIGIVVNIGLAVFNLIPIPPLDGSKILYGILPEDAITKVAAFEKYGFLLLIVLIVSGAIDRTIIPIIYKLSGLLM